jgi:quercetin dioxygenase-like cupin family protein
VNSWDVKMLDLRPRLPEILSSSDAARAIVLDLAAGESLSEHEVHERACLVVLDGEIQVTTAAGEHVRGSVRLLVRGAV